MRTDDDSGLDVVEAVAQLPEDDKAAVGYTAAQVSCVIEANFPGVDSERIENLAIEFGYRLFMAQRDH